MACDMPPSAVRSKPLKERRYTPLRRAASPGKIGNIELHFPSDNTDFHHLLQRSRLHLQRILNSDIRFILQECLVEEVISPRDYVSIDGIITEDATFKVRELIDAVLYGGKSRRFLKLLATPHFQNRYPDLETVVPPAPVPLCFSQDAHKVKTDGNKTPEPSDPNSVGEYIGVLLDMIIQRGLEGEFLKTLTEDDQSDTKLTELLLRNGMEKIFTRAMRSVKRLELQLLSPTQNEQAASASFDVNDGLMSVDHLLKKTSTPIKNLCRDVDMGVGPVIDVEEACVCGCSPRGTTVYDTTVDELFKLMDKCNEESTSNRESYDCGCRGGSTQCDYGLCTKCG